MVEIGIEMWHTQLTDSVTCHITTLRDVSILRSDKKFKQFIALILETLHVDTFSPTVSFIVHARKRSESILK